MSHVGQVESSLLAVTVCTLPSLHIRTLLFPVAKQPPGMQLSGAHACPICNVAATESGILQTSIAFVLPAPPVARFSPASVLLLPPPALVIGLPASDSVHGINPSPPAITEQFQLPDAH